MVMGVAMAAGDAGMVAAMAGGEGTVTARSAAAVAGGLVGRASLSAWPLEARPLLISAYDQYTQSSDRNSMSPLPIKIRCTRNPL